jgi:hypothetical protein
MEGPPMWLMVHPNAEPIAHHTPIPVPLHNLVPRVLPVGKALVGDGHVTLQK